MLLLKLCSTVSVACAAAGAGAIAIAAQTQMNHATAEQVFIFPGIDPLSGEQTAFKP
jgi:hypothetical protein